jgi:hypothetical protein
MPRRGSGSGGCPGSEPSASPVSATLSRAAQSALADDFVTTIQRVLFINAAFWLLTALLSLALPRARPSGIAAAAH